MKKLILASLATLALAMPTHAHAGILFLLGSWTGPSTTLAGVMLIVFGGPAGIVVDASGNIPVDQLAEKVAEAYPQIDNPAVINELATAVRDAYKNSGDKKSTGAVEVRLDGTQARGILSHTDLPAVEADKIVKSLI